MSFRDFLIEDTVVRYWNDEVCLVPTSIAPYGSRGKEPIPLYFRSTDTHHTYNREMRDHVHRGRIDFEEIHTLAMNSMENHEIRMKIYQQTGLYLREDKIIPSHPTIYFEVKKTPYMRMKISDKTGSHINMDIPYEPEPMEWNE